MLIQVIDSSMVNVLRADQRTVTLMKYQVLKKYLGLGCMFGGLLLISKSLRMFYSASVIAEGTALLFLAWIVLRVYPDRRPTPAQFSWPLYRELLTYGLPMTFGYELAGVILIVGDRYVIKGTFRASKARRRLVCIRRPTTCASTCRRSSSAPWGRR